MTRRDFRLLTARISLAAPLVSPKGAFPQAVAVPRRRISVGKGASARIAR